MPFPDGAEDKAMQDNPLLTVDEVAERLRLSRNTIYDLIHTHQIPHVRLGRKFRIPTQALERWIESASAAEIGEPDEVRIPRRLVS